LIRIIRHSCVLFAVLIGLCSPEGRAQSRAPAGDISSLVEDIVRHTVTGRLHSTFASERDLLEWRKAFTFFHARAFDSCRRILTKYNYSLLHAPEGKNANAYDVIRENNPVSRGWGTFIFNHTQTKRLYVEVEHPLRDDKSARIGADLFRKIGAEWLLIAGTDRSGGGSDDDITRLNEALFQQWHEMLTDLIHVTLSVHTFPAHSYPHPIDGTDIVVSNGRTTDQQWGISEISLALRDSLRSARIPCALAMYDSGYARLSGAGSPQGTFSNDSVGFGHWLNLEFSDRIQGDPAGYARLIAAVDRALDVTGQKVSRQMNRAFGLVTPRVVRVDPQHRMLFPPAEEDQYRVISFNSREVKHDTVVVRVGDWVNLKGPSGGSSTISSLDPRNVDFIQQFGSRSPRDPRKEIAKIVERPSSSPLIRKGNLKDSSSAGGDNDLIDEPLQVHRIPLEPLLASTVTGDYLSGMTPFRWEGAVASGFSPSVRVFQLGAGAAGSNELSSPAHLLIPIINSSYNPTGAKFVGVQMTTVLMSQITRLADAARTERDITLLAEQDEQGKFFLRIFPGKSNQLEGALIKQ